MFTASPSRYRQIRRATERLCEPLSVEDQVVQSMPDASPTKWHLAHTTWFFERFVLSRAAPGYRPVDPTYESLFNSYYRSVGSPFPRPQRGVITRPGVAEVTDYRRRVDDAMLRLLDRELSPAIVEVVEVGLHHEQQHQELILTDIKHAFAQSPIAPRYRPRPEERRVRATPLEWWPFDGGLMEIGHAGEGFAYDNELPRHRVFLEPFQLASRLVTAGEYRAFIEDGGYRRPELWLSEGWDWLAREGIRGPLYWREDGRLFTLHGVEPIADNEPVVHVSYYEADAFARWSGARLPRESELEVATRELPIEGTFADGGILHPQPAGPGLSQLFGDAWEWTQSAYAPYPGYRPLAGALGQAGAEYNGKFMVGQLVLRGGSCCSPQSHLRPSYRNFFPPSARWQLTGIRLARDPE